jgi:hypothetical protein
MVRYKRFRQPCGIQPTACWKALESGRLEVGEMEYPVAMNRTRNHMAEVEGCSGNCGRQTRTLERKITQVLMEVLVKKDWIWWNAERGQVAAALGRATTLLRNGEAILENGLWVWKPGDEGPILARVGGANLPADGGGTASINQSRSTVGRTQDRFGYSCSAAGECAAEAIFCCPTENSHHLEA